MTTLTSTSSIPSFGEVLSRKIREGNREEEKHLKKEPFLDWLAHETTSEREAIEPMEQQLTYSECRFIVRDMLEGQLGRQFILI
jgi:hypothetical protein